MTELEYFNGDELAATTWRNKYAAEGEENPDDTLGEWLRNLQE